MKVISSVDDVDRVSQYLSKSLQYLSKDLASDSLTYAREIGNEQGKLYKYHVQLMIQASETILCPVGARLRKELHEAKAGGIDTTAIETRLYGRKCCNANRHYNMACSSHASSLSRRTNRKGGFSFNGLTRKSLKEARKASFLERLKLLDMGFNLPDVQIVSEAKTERRMLFAQYVKQHYRERLISLPFTVMVT